ncbi:MAG: hypothetical protein J6Z82_03390 [Schwartzia sp.]|nr:hypothetical protein [Schwartzia sp. (in: firmicutes)]
MKNKLLRDIQREWVENIADGYVKRNRDAVFSYPLFLALPESVGQEPYIMIVGQEPDKLGRYDDGWELDAIRQSCLDYLSVQLGEKNPVPKLYLTGNSSPFWNAFRLMRKAGKRVCWNNIDKLHRIGADGKTQRLSIQDEEALNRPYGREKKSLLQQEIEVVRPSIVWLAVGPNREESIEFSFGLPKGTLREKRPQKDQWLSEIGVILKLDMPVYWTYHPNYLNFLGVLHDCVHKISVSI